ncbi:hypothetical protein ACFLZZ_03730 [Nanoarchaeota archaeon]
MDVKIKGYMPEKVKKKVDEYFDYLENRIQLQKGRLNILGGGLASRLEKSAKATDKDKISFLQNKVTNTHDCINKASEFLNAYEFAKHNLNLRLKNEMKEGADIPKFFRGYITFLDLMRGVNQEKEGSKAYARTMVKAYESFLEIMGEEAYDLEKKVQRNKDHKVQALQRY